MRSRSGEHVHELLYCIYFTLLYLTVWILEVQPATSQDYSPRETIGGASGGGGALFSTTKLGTDVGITPEYTRMHTHSLSF